MLNLILNLKRRSLLIAPSFIATSILTTAIPTYAATFAFSQAEIKFNNFSNFGTIELINKANVSAQTNGGIFDAENKALNNSTASPLEINSSAFSIASGENRDYEGTAETQARVLGNFDIDAGKLFSFDFSASVNLETEIDDPTSEKANANSDLAFYLFDTTNIAYTDIQDFFTNFPSNNNSNLKYQPLDFFTLNGSVNTFGLPDFLNYQRSQGVSFIHENKETNFGGASQETAQTIIKGNLQRAFTNKSKISLIALRQTKSQVKVPEPSILLGFALFTLFFAATNKPLRRLGGGFAEPNSPLEKIGKI